VTDVDDALAPEDRVPCPDELCTGLVGPEGRCGTCGLAVAGAASPAIGANAGPAAATEEPPLAETLAPATDESEAAPSPDERVLCPDELCTGILGADARCGTCGRAA
jgi:hypothetical protein